MAGAVFAPASLAEENTGSSDSQTRFNLVTQMQAVQAELRSMRGILEENSHQIETLRKRQLDLYSDLDQRISDLEQGSSEQTSGQLQPDRSTNSATPAIDQPDVSISQPPGSEGLGSAPNSAPQASGSINPAQESLAANAASLQQNLYEERSAYQAAFDLLTKGQYQEAVTEFRGFLGKYPGSQYAGNAQYWIGEAYYVTRDFDQALLEFNKIVTDYPDSPKLPDALLKVGYANYELQRWEAAKSALNEVIVKWPTSSAASLAKGRLAKGPKPAGLAKP